MPFPGLLLTRSFTYFLQFHNEKLPSALSGQSLPCLIIDNYEYTLKINEEEFVAYNWHDNKVTLGKGTQNRFEGKEMKFESNEPLSAKYVYVGLMEGHKFHRSGFFLDQNEVFEG